MQDNHGSPPRRTKVKAVRCRHCYSVIPAPAKVCQHCSRHQSVWNNQYLLQLGGLVLTVLSVAFAWGQAVSAEKESTKASAALAEAREAAQTADAAAQRAAILKEESIKLVALVMEFMDATEGSMKATEAGTGGADPALEELLKGTASQEFRETATEYLRAELVPERSAGAGQGAGALYTTLAELDPTRAKAVKALVRDGNLASRVDRIAELRQEIEAIRDNMRAAAGGDPRGDARELDRQLSELNGEAGALGSELEAAIAEHVQAICDPGAGAGASD